MKTKFGILLYLLVILMDIHLARSSVAVCITNCVQCKQMYGHYFEGKMCGDTCITSKGRSIPDCNNPGTLNGYLKRLYKKWYPITT